MNKIICLLLLFFLIYLILNHKKEGFTWAYGYYEKEKYEENIPFSIWQKTFPSNKKILDFLPCSVLDYRYPFLWAMCENDNGKQVETSIDLSKCYKNRFRNVDGILECW